MRGFPDRGKEKRAVGYHIGNKLNLTHLNGAISSGGNDLLFDNFLSIEQNRETLTTFEDIKHETISPDDTFVIIGLTEPARRCVWWEGQYSPTFRPYAEEFCDFKLPTEVNYYFSQEEIIYYNNIKNIILIYNYLKAKNYKFVILEGLKNDFHLMDKFVNVETPTMFNLLRLELKNIKESKEWIGECYREWIVSNSKNPMYADDEKTILDYSEFIRLDKHPTEEGAEAFADYLLKTYTDKFKI